MGIGCVDVSGMQYADCCQAYQYGDRQLMKIYTEWHHGMKIFS